MTTTDTGELAHAVGVELQQQRETRGWSRPALAKWSQGQPTAGTLITWEKATRSMSLRQLSTAARLYQLRPSGLLARAERCIGWDSDLAVNLTALAATQHDALRPVAQWAQNLLDAGGSPIRGLTTDTLAAMADSCRLSIAHLTILLTTEAPVHP
ncbi:hypothetical protein SAMN05421837_11872 [Amycolatopsis pretoriensis]|uniref:Helix-turn-helix domain-containing protein n=2 Tax=Amycolatopsis pretoriensis TaxID=218821 RepID=A0A1H5RKT3_9PSEU|nr:hypothetical protein [Amycolatopsis pretoriensis]SEF38121.1 hypothetical protein SAMN05421837_11872 [Amycolatopsis pretoriensis]